ncbi:nucleolar protein 14 [Lepidopterella palustris CBS 459.81]|uniref:Nucleolar protein 14 n=1 Tax=Lepidopterella palustris CBS 459.81 TaxID=1314670 RepID=A0A8E2EHE1_9PEZI|nr:nucleolar protein 14 [Lepidopterella palustris CBS 459.81]
MPPSQLKRLKTSLREQGITGPEKSKKQKKRGYGPDQRVQRNAALANIRESFNPFEFKTPARPKKFEVTTSRLNATNSMVIRPSVSKSLGEERRRRTLLPELRRRNKVGGILDRRIGENDPTMTPEERMLERFTREKQRKKGASVFDLEEAEDEDELTHLGRSLDFESVKHKAEDYDAASVATSSEDDRDGLLSRKRRRDITIEEGNIEGEAKVDQPERKKSKTEVMKEVIAKSKQHKYERQQAKEEDDELRLELDKDLQDVLAALKGHLNPPSKLPAALPQDAPANNFSINPDRAALLNGKSRTDAEKEYDERVRQMLQDQRAKPTERTKTEEEKAQEEVNRLKKLEENRILRMEGVLDEESEDDVKMATRNVEEDEGFEADDAADFGLPGAPLGSRPEGVEDEDNFEVDDDLIASGSEGDAEFSDSSDEGLATRDDTQLAEDDEFLKDILPNICQPDAASTSHTDTRDRSQSSKLAYTYPCPRSHSELLKVLRGIAPSDIPTVVQRIRALYHPQLHPENKGKLADFSATLVDHISYMSCQKPAPPLAVLETIIRHIHSLSRTFPERIANGFRSHLQQLQTSNAPTPGDLTILTAIGSIYPTSDHFHQVVTPAITLMARWLGMSTPQNSIDIATGAYIGALCLQYQRLSKRYIPELVRYTLLALKSPFSTPDLLSAHLKNLTAMADLWTSKTAFTEIFTPEALNVIKEIHEPKALQRLQILLNQTRLARRPLELHHHRPLPIKTSVPKFEEGFNPDKHYDPDKERAEASKLRAEYKRERKGALRELRKDANFIAREKLREKKEKDKAYEVKYKRLVAEIQGEEGKEKNAYEREKRARKGRK